MVFAVRMVRAGIGALLLIVAVPLMIAGGGLWAVAGHGGHDGAFAAGIERLRADGRAAVVTDVDALLRADAPFARGGQTTLSLSARGPGGPLFLGLGPYPAIERYLAGVAQTRVTRIRLARGGPLPLDAVALPGDLAPHGPPTEQPFWLATSTGLTRDGRVEDALTWSPSSVRGRDLAFVIMNVDGSAGIDVTLSARLKPGWLPPTAGGLLILGIAVFLLALLTLAWPHGRRQSRLESDSPRVLAPERPNPPPQRDPKSLPPLPPVGLRFMWPPSAAGASTKEEPEVLVGPRPPTP
jgi:hypothetical protein